MKNRLGNITINITNRCNYRCRHCSFDSGIKEVDELLVEEWNYFLDEARLLGGTDLDIGGGEPILRADLSQIISGAKERNYKVKLLTNGSLLTDEKLRELHSAGLDAIAISLDGSNPDVHNLIRLRRKESFYSTLDSIQRAKKQGFFVKVNSVVFSETIDDTKKLIRLVQSLGIDEHRICYFTPIGRGEGSGLTAFNPVIWFYFAKGLGNPERVYFGLPYVGRGAKFERDCLIANGNIPLQVMANGDIYACVMQNRCLGNVREKNLAKITKDFEFNNCQYTGICNACPLRKFRLEGLSI